MRHRREEISISIQVQARTAVRAELPVVARTPLTTAVASLPVSFVEHGARRTLIVAGVMLAALLQTVDATIVNVALPTIQGTLGASVDEATWVVTAYVIANVVVIPLTPWLQARFGRKKYFLISIAGFTAASVLCGMASSLGMLILFRVVQGAFGGGLLATAQVILRETFPPQALGTSQSIFALGAVLGPSIGPTLGGIITDNLSWQWVFDINIVPGILAVVLLALYLRESPTKRSDVDVAGISLLIVTIASLQYVLDQGQHDDWFSSAPICTATATALVAGASFVWWELRTGAPIVDLRVLARRGVAAASAVGVGIAISIYGVLLLLPQFTVTQLGFTSTLAGLLMGMRAIPVALLTLWVGRIANSNRIDLRLLVGGGLTIAALGSLWLSSITTSTVTIAALAPPLLFTGFGIAFIFSPTLVCALRAVPPKDAPKASAFVTLWTQLGGSIAAASLVTLADRREQFHQDILAGSTTLHSMAVAQFVHADHAQALYQLVVNQATTLAFADSFRIVGLLGLATVPVVALLRTKSAQ